MWKGRICCGGASSCLVFWKSNLFDIRFVFEPRRQGIFRFVSFQYVHVNTHNMCQNYTFCGISSCTSTVVTSLCVLWRIGMVRSQKSLWFSNGPTTADTSDRQVMYKVVTATPSSKLVDRWLSQTWRNCLWGIPRSILPDSDTERHTRNERFDRTHGLAGFLQFC